MLRYKEIEDALLNVVGWQQHTDPAKHIDERLTISESGLTFQNAHPLVTLDNAAAAMPDSFGAIYPIWSSDKGYTSGEIVSRNGDLFRAVSPSMDADPATDQTKWRAFNPLSEFLELETRAGISQLVQNFITSKIQANQTRTLVASAPLYTTPARLNAVVQNNSNLVGFAFRVNRATGVTAKLNRISLQFSEPVFNLKIYIFSEDQPQPLNEFVVNYTKERGGVQWFELNDVYFKNGVQYYIAYNQNDLPITCEALTISRDWSVAPCGTCNVGDINQYNQLKKYVTYMPFRYHTDGDSESGSNGDFNSDYNNDFANHTGTSVEAPDSDRLFYTASQNYGLNLDFEIGCDLTDFIIRNRHIFATALQLQVAERLLRTLALNPNARVNRNQLNVDRSNILYELDGNTDGRPGGLGYRLTQALKALSLDTNGIDRDCLGCESKGVRYIST